MNYKEDGFHSYVDAKLLSMNIRISELEQGYELLYNKYLWMERNLQELKQE